MKEDSPSSAVDLDILQTLGTHTNKSRSQPSGLYTVGGQLKSPAFIVNPKFDPEKGEMITMGYDVKFDSMNDVYYMRFDKDGSKLITE